MVILMGKIMRKLFFGQLRAAEMEHLIERSWYAVTETCLAFTVFRDDFSPRFVAHFTLLLFLKCFHWLAEDRVDYMERSPLISVLFHSRVVMLLSVLGFADVYLINHAYYSTLIKGASVQLVFGFEYAILFTVVVHIFVKYTLHNIDLQSENPWENKVVYLLYTELFLGFIKVVLYVLFLVIMIKVHTFPLFAIRPMYLTIRTFKKALNDVIMSRRAINNMNTLYPDATSEELASGDNVCIICREDMESNAKKLPCSHIFHVSCLRSWFQRQQTCPTCRMDVLRPTTPGSTQQPQQQAPPQQPQVPQAPPFMGFPGWQPPPPPAPPSAPSAPSSTAAASASTTPSSPASTTLPTPPPFMMNPFMMPFSIPMPTPPVDFSGLSDEELQQMEGNERAAVEARIQVLRNVHSLLDAAIVQLQQYSTVAGSAPAAPTRTSAAQPVPEAQAMPSSSGVTVSSVQTPIVSSSVSSNSPSSKVETEPQPSTSKIVTSPEPSAATSEPSPSTSEDSEKNELRKRRLEKFNQQSNDEKSQES